MSAKPASDLHPSLVDQAIGFAARAHDGQRRKTGNLPYIAHPMGVAMILQAMGCAETVVAAGLLHDVVEDTAVTLEEVRRRFGGEVAEIVALVTEPPKADNQWEARKQHAITILREAPLEAKLVAAADKYHNLSHTLHTRRRQGATVWENFGRGKRRQAWYYRTVLESLLANVPDPDAYPIFARLEAVIAALFGDIPAESPAD